MFKQWKLSYLIVVMALGVSYSLFLNAEAGWTFETDEVKGKSVTTDTKKIQAAIDSTPSGGTLNIPPGVYNLSKNPEHKSVSEYGESHHALKITKPITIIMEDVVFNINTEEKYGVFWIAKTSDVHLKGGTLTGNQFPADESLISSIGVFIQNSQNNSIDNMTTRNFSQGIHLHHSKHNLLKNVTSENNYGSGIISFASAHNIIDSCIVRNSGDGHLSLYNGENNHILNCVVTEDRKDHVNEQGITFESEVQSKVENSTVSGFYYGIDVKNGSEDNIIESNNVYNNQYNIDVRPGDGGGNLMTPSHRIQIINNVAINPRTDSNNGIYIDIGEGHTVVGNTLNPNQLLIHDMKAMQEFEEQNFYVE